MKKSLKFFLVMMLLSITFLEAQIKIGSGGDTNPDPSSSLDLSSTSTKGLLIPRVNNQQRTNIQNPVAGLVVFNVEPTKGFIEWYNGVRWENATMYNSATNVSDLPSNPTDVVATDGILQATVTYSASLASSTESDDFPVTGYTITTIPADVAPITVSASTFSATITGLTAGTSYTFSVVANTAAGPSDAGISNAVIPYDYPGVPTLQLVADPYNYTAPNTNSVLYVPGNTTALLHFNAPTYTGGRPIVEYTVVSVQGTPVTTNTGTTSPITITGLVVPSNANNATNYTFQIKVKNSAGLESQFSVSSNTIRVRNAIPGSPRNLRAEANGTNITFTWDPPASGTGGPVHNYIMQLRGTLNAQTWSSFGNQVLASSGQTTVTVNTNPNSSEVTYRVIARNSGTVVSTSPEVGISTNMVVLKPVPNSTTEFFDNFTVAPTIAKWELDPTPFGLFGDQVSTPTFFGNDKIYGQADSRWLISRESSTISSSAQTVHTIVRNGKNVEVQFTWTPLLDGAGEGWRNRFGFRSVGGASDGVSISFFQNNVNTLNMEKSGPDANIGGIMVQNIPGVNGSQVWHHNNPHVAMRIIFLKDGGMRIWANGSLLASWSAAEMPASFDQLKFFVRAGRNGTASQKIDDFFIFNYD